MLVLCYAEDSKGWKLSEASAGCEVANSADMPVVLLRFYIAFSLHRFWSISLTYLVTRLSWLWRIVIRRMVMLRSFASRHHSETHLRLLISTIPIFYIVIDSFTL